MQTESEIFICVFFFFHICDSGGPELSQNTSVQGRFIYVN